MATDARLELEAEYKSFSKARFPRLGYKVEGLPEADSVLAGLISQVLARRRRVPMGDTPIIGEDLAARVADVCRQHGGSPDAVELEGYVASMRRLESRLRRLPLRADEQ
jgi:hypothetical protein